MTQQAQKMHSLSIELDEAKTTIRMLNKRNESDIVSKCFLVTEKKWGLDEVKYPFVNLNLLTDAMRTLCLDMFFDDFAAIITLRIESSSNVARSLCS